jgi:predicted glycoside hydrolase/deacetylase ChbG (UPF0249 family)
MTLWDAMGLSGKRVLILHHDDLGVTHAQNQAYRTLGYATGSIMAPSAWAMELRGRAGSDLGAHVTLTSEWPAPRMRPLTGGASLRDSEGFFWPSLNEAWGHVDADEAAFEMGAQFEALLHLGIDVTHLDTHMGAILRPDIAVRFLALGAELGLPVIAPSNFEELPIPEDFKEALTEIRERADLPAITVIDTYEAPVQNRREWYIERLTALGPGVYHVLHHAQVPTEEGRQLLDWEKRHADFEALSDETVKAVLAEFVPLTYAAVRTALRRYEP